MSNVNKNIALIVMHTVLDMNESSDSSDSDESDEILLRELSRQSPVPRIRCKNYICRGNRVLIFRYGV